MGNGGVPPIDIIGMLTAVTLLTMVATPLLAVVILGRFRSAVRRSMLTTASPSGVPPAQPAPTVRATAEAETPLLEILGAEDVPRLTPGRRPLVARAVSRARVTALWYAAAGLVHAITATVVLFVLEDLQFLPLRTLAVFVVLAWPVVPTVLLVGVADRRMKLLGPLVYALAVGLLASLTSVRLRDLVTLWVLMALPPTVLVMAVAGRRLRAVGPFLLPSVFVGSLGFLVFPWIAWPLVMAGSSLRLAELLVFVLVAAVCALAFLNVPWVARRYRRKAASDQRVLLDVWWLIVTLAQCLFLSTAAGWLALIALLPYGAYRIVVRVSNAFLLRTAAEQRPSRLLLLRAFGSRGRSQRLLRELSTYWRHVGSIQLIAGTDLASENLEPHEFLDFVTGRLTRRFVTDEDDLAQRMAQLDLRPDPDGRFRVNEFFCHDDTWRVALQRLVRENDVVLIDLRGFTPAHAGVVYELQQLCELVPLQRVVAIVDATTDEQFLRSTLASAWSARSATSVNQSGPETVLRALRAEGRRFEVTRLLQLLGEAARPDVPLDRQPA